MPRLTKKKPLRGSVRQNTMLQRDEESRPWLGFSARLALLVLGAVAIIVFAAWIWHSEWPHRQWDRAVQAGLRLTQKAGFSVSDVLVEGRAYTDRKELMDALQIKAGMPLFAFDPHESYEKILALPWTEEVSVLRSLPNKVVVKLTERQPLARWQHDGTTVVIDKNGREITAAKPERFLNLPLVVGNAAPEQTKSLLATLQAFPTVQRALRAAVRVGERRWNLHIHPNIVVRLPEIQMEAALTKLSQLIERDKITERAIVAIDLRLPDRTVLEPQTPAASVPLQEATE